METFEQHLHLPVTKIDDAERTLGLLKVGAPVPAGTWDQSSRKLFGVLARPRAPTS